MKTSMQNKVDSDDVRQAKNRTPGCCSLMKESIYSGTTIRVGSSLYEYDDEAGVSLDNFDNRLVLLSACPFCGKRW